MKANKQTIICTEKKKNAFNIQKPRAEQSRTTICLKQLARKERGCSRELDREKSGGIEGVFLITQEH